MAVLTTQQRSALETAVKKARKDSEAGATNALESLAIDQPEPFAHMTADQRTLWENLRDKAFLLGDSINVDGNQKIEHLAYELAYETWHKMLFARFLEANHLLMHPDGVAVSFADVEELAKDEGYADKWEAAAHYASKMLPAIFRTEDPLMQVAYSTNDRIKLETILDGLENAIFEADDALGWVYQFWQADEKKRIEEEEKSGQLIDGARIPAKTQLFTEPYMVHFLIDNTLGAWWVSRNPGVNPPVKFKYLRLLQDGTPAAGKFEGWPDKTATVTSLDPCMGSGHFVASLFTVFALLRMYEEGLTKEEATDKVIAENLHGLELDPRCTQIAAFNLALTAWKFCGYYKELPEMNLACSGIAPKGKEDDWVRLVSKETDLGRKQRLENGMKALYAHFQLAPELGSLLDPTTIKGDPLFTASFEELQPALKKALENEADTEQMERGVMAAGIAKVGRLLANKYSLQITNVPYIKKGKLSEQLETFLEKNYPNSKESLETVFIERMLKSASQGCSVCSVIPQNWLFLKTYKNFRKKLLTQSRISIIAKLGVKGFQTTMWDFNVMLFALTNSLPNNDNQFTVLDVSEFKSIPQKDLELKGTEINLLNQKIQLTNPDFSIITEKSGVEEYLSKYADGMQGISTSDYFRFGRNFWEVIDFNIWMVQQEAPNERSFFSGRSVVIKFRELVKIAKNVKAYIRGKNAWNRKGIAVAQMGSNSRGIYNGALTTDTVALVIPKNQKDLLSIAAYCFSDEYSINLRKINQKGNLNSGYLVKVSFDRERWQKIAAEKYPNGLPQPYSDESTQWLFHGHPIKAGNPLQVAVARLLGYRWPAETDTEMELAPEARDLIEKIKGFYHLSDEDGIFCLPSVNSEQAGSDRLRTWLQEVFGSEWNNQTITELLAKEGASSSNLDDWLRKEFFSQHCKVFQNRPFIWHIWDGRNDGFSALVNYHKLDKDNLSKLIYAYLGDWIRMCEAKKKAGESGADGLLHAALKLKEKLEAILEGEPPYDIFVRWKSLAEQPMGWEPDLNDGVRLNIRPFVEAGVLRNKFNVKWGVDRGKNPPGSHWGEVRDNDRHLTLAEKREARDSIQITEPK